VTPRKKAAVAMGIGHALGVVVAVIIFVTTSTPAWVPLSVGFLADIAGFYLGMVITKPEIPT